MTKSPANGGTTLVVGATGMLGSEIVRLLREERRPVRALVRSDSDPAKRAALEASSVEVVTGDLKNPVSVAAACQGVDAIISTATAIVSGRGTDSIETVDRLGQLALVQAAEKARVGRFVFLSFPRNDLDYAFQRAKREVEAALSASTLPFAVLQSSAFMEVWLSPILGFDPSNGRARILGTGERPVSWISTHDVARFAVAASERAGFDRKTIPLGGPDALSQLDVVRIFETLGAPPCTLEHVPEVALQGMLTGADNPVAQAFAAGMLVTARGQYVDPGPQQALLPGRMISVRDYASGLLASRTKQPQ